MMSGEDQRKQGRMIQLGTVAELDAAAARVRVSIGELLTDWLPWLAIAAGRVRHWSAPKVGEQVVVLCPEGDSGAGLVLQGVFSDQRPAPSSDPNKDLRVYDDGAEVEYDQAAHALRATLPGGATAEITADGGITLNGPLTVNGDSQFNGAVECSETVTAATDVIGGGKSLKSHVHAGVQPGGGVSGPPQ